MGAHHAHRHRCRAQRAEPRAEGLYLKALALSRALLEDSLVGEERADDRVAAFVVTHLNLADLHAEAEHTALAALRAGCMPLTTCPLRPSPTLH